MATTLFERIATLARADAHGVVEALEERALLLKQHLRDAELELVQKRGRLAGLASEEERLAEGIERRARELDGLDADVALALQGDKRDLARFAIRRLLPLRRERDAMQRALAKVRATRAELEERLAEQEDAFRTLRERVHARLREGEREPGAEAGAGVSDEEVELELLRRTDVARGEEA
jgi:phage shock protein A